MRRERQGADLLLHLRRHVLLLALRQHLAAAHRAALRRLLLLHRQGLAHLLPLPRAACDS